MYNQRFGNDVKNGHSWIQRCIRILKDHLYFFSDRTHLFVAVTGNILPIQNDLSSQVQDLHDLEEEAFDNMPESMQDSDRGTAMQDTMDELQSAVDLCSEASDTIDSIVDSLQSAAG